MLEDSTECLISLETLQQFTVHSLSKGHVPLSLVNLSLHYGGNVLT